MSNIPIIDLTGANPKAHGLEGVKAHVDDPISKLPPAVFPEGYSPQTPPEKHPVIVHDQEALEQAWGDMEAEAETAGRPEVITPPAPRGLNKIMSVLGIKKSDTGK